MAGFDPARRSLAAMLAAVLLLACGKDGASPAGPTPPRRPSSVTFTQIWVGYAVPGGVAHVKRTKLEARDLASSLIARLLAGERMEPLVREFSDDREPGQEPFNDGSYTKTRDQIRHPGLRDVVFSLKVGEVAKEPVDTGVAYFVVRRDD